MFPMLKKVRKEAIRLFAVAFREGHIKLLGTSLSNMFPSKSNYFLTFGTQTGCYYLPVKVTGYTTSEQGLHLLFTSA